MIMSSILLNSIEAFRVATYQCLLHELLRAETLDARGLVTAPLLLARVELPVMRQANSLSIGVA